MAEGGAGKLVRSIGEGRTENGREITVADGKGLRESVIEGQIRLVVVAHRVVISRGLPAGIGLARRIVHAHEAVVRALAERLRGVVEVRLLVGPGPVVVQVRSGAVVRWVERENLSQ